MAFKNARNNGVDKAEHVTDKNTEEILDYLMKSKTLINEFSFENLKKKLSDSLTKRIIKKIFDALKISKNKTYSSFIILTFITGGFICSCNQTYAIIQKENNTIIENDDFSSIYKDIKENKSIEKETASIQEELKDNLSDIKPGQPLLIVPKNSRVYTVKKDDDLVKISNKYNISVKEIVKSNSKADLFNIKEGDTLIIPCVEKRATRNYRNKLVSRGFSPSLNFSINKNFIWPADTNRKISSRFGYRWNRKHEGIDIPGNTGTPIFASHSGTVRFAGWFEEYGKCVIIDHGNGVETLYAHASKILAKVGDSIEVGSEIAKIGNTGRSTGPHLHFEVRINGTPRNPEKFL